MAHNVQGSGWAKPKGANANAKFHWFAPNNRSLCGKYGFIFADPAEFDRTDLGNCTDQCKSCYARFKKLKEAE